MIDLASIKPRTGDDKSAGRSELGESDEDQDTLAGVGDDAKDAARVSMAQTKTPALF